MNIETFKKLRVGDRVHWAPNTEWGTIIAPNVVDWDHAGKTDDSEPKKFWLDQIDEWKPRPLQVGDSINCPERATRLKDGDFVYISILGKDMPGRISRDGDSLSIDYGFTRVHPGPDYWCDNVIFLSPAAKKKGLDLPEVVSLPDGCTSARPQKPDYEKLCAEYKAALDKTNAEVRSLREQLDQFKKLNYEANSRVGALESRLRSIRIASEVVA